MTLTWPQLVTELGTVHVKFWYLSYVKQLHLIFKCNEQKKTEVNIDIFIITKSFGASILSCIFHQKSLFTNICSY